MTEQPPSFHIVRLTPPGRGAVATVLVFGEGTGAAICAAFRIAPEQIDSKLPVNRPTLQTLHKAPSLRDERAYASAREEVVIVRRPRGEFRLHGHGGSAAVARMIAVLESHGGRELPWDQWLAMQHPDDPIRAGAHRLLAHATTQRAASILLDQYDGRLREAFDLIEQTIVAGRPDEALRQIDTLLARAPLGQHMVDPWRVVIAGPPNVGKSSLINAVLGFQRAIVHDRPGTTRDAVAATTAIEGLPVMLIDTAGLRDTIDVIESAGIDRTRSRLRDADLVILVFDRSRDWTSTDEHLFSNHPSTLVVHNKCDLPPSGTPRPEGISLSAITGKGMSSLLTTIAQRLVPNPPPPGVAVPFLPRHVERLTACRDLIAAGRTEDALVTIMER